MRAALEEARRGFSQGEVPVGAIVVENKRIIARAHNCVEASGDPTAHAEIVAIRHTALQKGDWRLTEATLYTTLEPCPMCAGALLSARVKRVVWAAPDLRQGAAGSWIELLQKPHPIHSIDAQGGLFACEAGSLMTTFFQQQRERHVKEKIRAAAR